MLMALVRPTATAPVSRITASEARVKLVLKGMESFSSISSEEHSSFLLWQ